MVNIAQGDDILRAQVVQVRAPHAAHADACDIELLARSRHSGAQNMAGQDVEGGGGKGAIAQETAAGDGCSAGVGGRRLDVFMRSAVEFGV